MLLDNENKNLKATDFIVKGANIGFEVLAEFKTIRQYTLDETIYGLNESKDGVWYRRLRNFLIDNQKVTLKDKAYFFHMLALMVDAGIPVVQALKGLSRYCDNRRLKRILNTVAYDCENGSSFTDALSRFVDVFEESELGVIRSGEVSGRLNQVLFELSDQMSRKHSLALKLFAAAVYPVAVLVVLILVTVGMLVWVLPTLLNMFKDSGVGIEDLPLMTRLLIEFQVLFVGYWWVAVLGALVVYGVFLAYVGTDFGAVRFDRRKLLLPIVGKILRKVYALRFVSLLGLLINSGLPVIKALQITGNSIENRIYRLKTQEVIEAVRRGEKISDSLADCEFLFSSELVQMFRVGETSASLAVVAEKLSQQYDVEVQNSLTRISALFEPLMILFVGLFVAMMAFAVMAPIFSLNSLV